MMTFALARNWWSLALRGLLGILVGLMTLAWPGVTLAALVLMFAVYALVDGVANVAGAVHAAHVHERWGALVFEGLVGISAAVVTVFWPAITALIMVMVLSVWATITGAAEIAAAIRLRKYIAGEWLLLLSGVASILFGVMLAVAPVLGAIVISIWFGVYVLVTGVVLLALAFRLRSWHRQIPSRGAVPIQVR